MAPLAVLVRLLEDGCLHQDVTQDMSSLLLLLDVFLHQAITGPVLHANADEFAQSGVPCSYNHSKCGESGDRDGVKFLLPSWVLLVGRLGTVRVWQGFQRHLLSAAADEHRRGCLLSLLPFVVSSDNNKGLSGIRLHALTPQSLETKEKIHEAGCTCEHQPRLVTVLGSIF